MQPTYRLIALILLASALILPLPRLHAQDTTPIDYDELTWSPDGARLAYSSQEDIWVYDFATGEQRNLTGDVEGLDTSPVWSPDSAQIAFASTRGIPQPSNGVQLNNVWLMNVDGTDPINLTNTTDFSYSSVGFSPDGHVLVIGGTGLDQPNNDAATRAFLLDLRDLTLGTFASSQDAVFMNTSFSPNGQHVLFKSLGQDLASNQLWLAEFENGEVTPAHVILRGDGIIYQRYTWSPDSCCIAFSPVTLMIGGEPEVQLNISILNVATGVITPLADDLTGNQTDPFWSPDGTKIAFIRHDFTADSPNDEFWLINPDGSGAIGLATSVVGFKSYGVWSPDGTKIAFINGNFVADGSMVAADIWLINADGSNPQNLTGNFQ